MGGVDSSNLLTLKSVRITVCQAYIFSFSQLINEERLINVEEEIWKDIKDFEGYYQVSNLGRIRSVDRYVHGRYNNMQFKQGQIMKILHNKRVNVYEVHLKKLGQRKCIKVHRLVANAFLENDDVIKKTTVNHIDGKRSNNAANNLEWSSYSENLQHAYNVLHRPINSAKVLKRRCLCINKDANTETLYESIAQASRNTKISETQIRRIGNGECINDTYDFKIA